MRGRGQISVLGVVDPRVKDGLSDIRSKEGDKEVEICMESKREDFPVEKKIKKGKWKLRSRQELAEEDTLM